MIWSAVVELAPIEGDTDPWLPPGAAGAFTRVVVEAVNESGVMAQVEAHLGPLADVRAVRELGPADDSDGDLVSRLGERRLAFGEVQTFGNEGDQ